MSRKEIIEMRKALGLTQAQFAKKLGVHINSVGNWERGDTRPLGLALKQLEALRDGGESQT